MNRKEELLAMLMEEKDDPFLNYALGLEYLKELNYQAAMSYFQRTLELDNHYTAAYYQLGQIFRELDIVDVARDYLEKGKRIAEEQKDRRAIGEFEEMIDSLE